MCFSFLGQFLFGQKVSVSETQQCETHNAFQSQWKGSDEKGDVEEEEDEDHQFSIFMERLGAGKVLEE